MESKIGISFPSLQAKTMDATVWAEMTRVPLWYNPSRPNPVIPDVLAPFMEGKHYLSTKQVPSALILSKAGSQTVSKNRSLLLKKGFSIEERRDDDPYNIQVTTLREGEGRTSLYSQSLASMIRESQGLMDSVAEAEEDIDDDADHSGSEASDTDKVISDDTAGTIRLRKTLTKRIRYECPWKIHAASALANALGKDGPDVVVWSGDGIRLQDPLPPRLLGPKWEGSLRNKIRFAKIASDEVRLNLIMKHTHWGARLAKECADPESKIGFWARTLRSRLNRFLKGGPDPIWTADERRAISPGTWKPRSRSSRALRLIETLKTVDGIFTQRYLMNPAEVWTWERFDLFTLGNLSLLIGDEFLDGELPLSSVTIRTSYATLKAARKWFKLVSHKAELELHQAPPEEGGIWSRQLFRSWKIASSAEGHRYLYNIGIMAQTRGCGTPPPLVVLQSKRKFLLSVSLQEAPEDETMHSLRRLALKEVLDDLPAVAVTGLATKSRVTVTSSACWEKTRKEGGTTEAIKDMINAVDPMDKIPIRDLDTGSVECWKFANEFDTVGELIFWVSLDRVLRTPPEALRSAFLTVVREPGKARSVTKARACLKIVLDLVSKICSEPLAKGIRSSSSGMAASNHGWNFFNSFTTNEEKQETFRLLNRDETPFEGYVERTDTYEDLYASSTDYEEATDRLIHKVARDLGDPWMIKCGIPALLRGIVIETCYKPRSIYFKASGCLVDIGDPIPELGDDIHRITLRRGVLMGDPLTKPVLHLVNICNRHLQKRILDPDFYSSLSNSNEIAEALSTALDNLEQ